MFASVRLYLYFYFNEENMKMIEIVFCIQTVMKVFISPTDRMTEETKTQNNTT